MNCVAPRRLKLASPDLEFQISQTLTGVIQVTVGSLHLALTYSGHIKLCHYCRIRKTRDWGTQTEQIVSDWMHGASGTVEIFLSCSYWDADVETLDDTARTSGV